MPNLMHDESLMCYVTATSGYEHHQAFTFAMGIKRGFSNEEGQQSENVC
jgi:hypothetical protein